MASLRARKAADTKVGLLEALLERLDARSLSEISVAELCEDVGVSQPTFFNYYANKEALLVYFVQLWSVQMAAVVQGFDPDDPLGAIEALFAQTAAESAKHPGVMAEIVAFQAREPAPALGPPPSDAELRRAFPDQPALLEAPRDAGLESLVPPLLARAVALGQLPESAPLPLAFAAVASIFFGTAVVSRRLPEAERAETTPALYHTQLHWLWAALRKGVET